MNDQPASPSPKPVREGTGVAIICATAVILVALGAGGYLLKLELDRMANAKPEAPAEVTQALKDLRTQLDQQRADSATQLTALQNELATVKEQQEAQETPDVDAAIAPVQEKLDALMQQIQEAPTAAPEPVVEPAAAPIIDTSNPLRDYLSLRRKVESGQPYAAELAAMIPSIPASELEAITRLQAHAEEGLGADDEETDEAPAGELHPWMQSVNKRMKGLVSIKPSAAKQATPQVRAETMAALDRVEASLLSEAH